jgi:hypothetical protein
MHPVLHHNLYLVKEHVGLFKASRSYDVFDPATGEILLRCTEPNLHSLTKLLRFTRFKQSTPFDIHVTTPDEEPVIRVKRGGAVFLSKVDVLDEADEPVGGFRQKIFSLGGSFQVVGIDDQPLCLLTGKWTGWHFTFKHEETVLAEVFRKWSGVGKELFTSADNYMLQISDVVPPENPLRILIVGAVFCIDMVLKNR